MERELVLDQTCSACSEQSPVLMCFIPPYGAAVEEQTIKLCKDCLTNYARELGSIQNLLIK